MVGAAEGDDELLVKGALLGVVEPGEPHRRHHRLGARHVERHLVESGDVSERGDHVHDDGVDRAEHVGPQVLDALPPALHEPLVLLVPGHVHPVRPRHVQHLVSVEVDEHGAVGLVDDGGHFEGGPHLLLEREGDAVCVREADVTEAVGEHGFDALHLAARGHLETLAKGLESFLAPLDHRGRGAVGAEEVVAVEAVALEYARRELGRHVRRVDRHDGEDALV
mmetsp:Transcript_8990/g.20251  ORF Transcript_8990/g.20251 Transcript_8990/m.20251 type:complete len:223 (+) Transcript_8990:1035-1703(+)